MKAEQPVAHGRNEHRRRPLFGMQIIRLSAAALLAGAVACAPGVQIGDAGDSSAGETENSLAPPVRFNRDVDILLVIDNSGSMGIDQRRIAAGLEAFIARLDAAEANWRIAVTTTDVQNPVCEASTADDGGFEFSSCRQRANDFVFDPGGPSENNQYDQVCADYCQHDEIASLATLADDGALVARPWLQRQDGELNVAGMSAAEALACLIPQGINGCGFESPLEATFRALMRASAPSSKQTAFVRPEAVLAVVVVTDEFDCSHNDAYLDIFTDTESPLWHPDAGGRPYSSICWNAGVGCSGDGEPYEGCSPIDRGVDGGGVADPHDAVLHPFSRYVDVLEAHENGKQESMPGREVIVGVFAGVPPGYQAGEADLFYNRGDTLDVLQYGVAPGCTRSNGEAAALPPVRMRKWAEAFEVDEQRNLFSICQEDHGPSLDVIADAIENQLSPGCFGQCARDMDPGLPGMQVECSMMQGAVGVAASIDECLRAPNHGPYTWEDGHYVLPDGVEACFAALGDAYGDTPDMRDDLGDVCRLAGSNLEFKVHRRAAAPAQPGTVLHATCTLSEAPAIDCPEL